MRSRLHEFDTPQPRLALRSQEKVNTMKIKSLAVLASFIGATSLAGTSQATNVNTGKVTSIAILGTQYATFQTTGASGSAPACQTAGQPAGLFALDISTTKGKALLEVVQSAQLAGKNVGLGGAGTCLTVQTGLSIETVGILTIFT